MKGITFGEIHSYNDLNLILSKVEIPPAKPKTNYIDIPGGDGSVDLTEAHGEVKFYDRECRFTFTMNPGGDLSEAAWEAKKSEVSNLLNGNKFKIILDKDTKFYYVGRCEVNEYLSNKRLRQIVIAATVEPYKWTQEDTVVSVSLIDATPINGDGKMVSDDVLWLDLGRYWLAKPVSVYFDSDHLVTFSGLLVIQIGAGSTERRYICDGMQYTYDLYNYTLRSAYEVETEVVPDGFSVDLVNGRKTACPIITCTKDSTKIELGGSVYVLNAGEHKNPAIQLTVGSNPCTLYGCGTVTFAWREGAL